VLGVGASAVVFRASDRRLSREVAVKVLRDAEPSEDDAIRFRRAAKVLSALRHPNIPRILHMGTHDERTFVVTELCPGSPATIFMRPDNYLRPDEVVAVGLQLAGALAAVHAAGVVYRDLHPGNVLIDRGNPTRAWIFDFDQAEVSAEFYAALTERWATPPEERTEPKRGKPLQNMDYAAPEVRAGAAFSIASDVYALGLLLYRLLTGRRPFPVSGRRAEAAARAVPGVSA
jgi:serine/threonine protein kinase